MDRLETGGREINRIKEIENKIQKMEKKNSKNRKIIIPMLGIIILCGGLIVGVLSGYLIKLPHQQNDEFGLVNNTSKPGMLKPKSAKKK